MKKNRSKPARPSPIYEMGSHGFTLIEMLVVIAIIGIVAALVVNMNAKAQQMKRKAAVDGEKTKLVTLINAYHEKLGFYPPDNPNNSLYAGNPALFSSYEGSTATNPLLYELTGATNQQGNIILFTGNVTPGSYSNVFNLLSVNNANQDAPPQNFFAAGLKTSEYTNYTTASGYTNLFGLVVPVANQITTIPNYWHYDASSPTRHNQSSFDLWAEYPSGAANGLIITNGNWQ